MSDVTDEQIKQLMRKRTAWALLLVLVQANGNGEDDCSVEHFFSAGMRFVINFDIIHITPYSPTHGTSGVYLLTCIFTGRMIS